MTFGPAFPAVFSKSFTTQLGGGAWWNAFGAVPVANCLIAYQAKGAASYAASKINLANPGTYNASDGTAYPAWDTAIGWTFTRASNQYLDIGGGTGPTLSAAASFIARITPADSGTNRYIVGSSANNALDFYLDTANKPSLIVLGVAVVGAASTAVSTNKVVCATYSAAGAFQFYLDGATDGNGTNDRAVSSDTDRIGRTTGNNYGGVMVAAAVYDVVLTPAQVLTITNALIAL